MTKDYPWGKGTIKYIVDLTNNDSDKDITIPTSSGKIAQILWIIAQLTTTATVGNRILQFDQTIFISPSTRTQVMAKTGNIAASQIGSMVLDFTGNLETTTTVGRAPFSTATDENVTLRQSLPPLYLPYNSNIRIRDAAAIDAAADDLHIVICYLEYDA